MKISLVGIYNDFKDVSDRYAKTRMWIGPQVLLNNTVVYRLWSRVQEIKYKPARALLLASLRPPPPTTYVRNPHKNNSLFW